MLNNASQIPQIKSVFKNMSFTFYAYFKPSLREIKRVDDLKDTFQNYFGQHKVAETLTRIETKVASLDEKLMSEIFLKSDLSQFESWMEIDNLVGCLIHNITLNKFFIKTESTSVTKLVSILRVKGFFPNKLINIILTNHIK